MSDEKEATRGPEKTGGMTKDEVALELTRFIAGTTGLGRPSGGAGFTGKAPKSPEEQVDVLLQLFERCREVVGK